MGLHVGPQVRSVSELFSTVSTAERPLPSVRPHVALQQPESGEPFAAHFTLVTEAVRQDVHGQGGKADVLFVADVTGFGLTGTVVSLSVSREVGAGGEMFTTLLALVLQRS